MLRSILLLTALALWFAVGQANAVGVCIGCGAGDTAVQQGVAPTSPGSTGARPRAYSISAQPAPAVCARGYRYCVVVTAHNNRVSLYENGSGVRAFDAVVRPTQGTRAGPLLQIDRHPTWCPTDNLRRQYGLPPGCIPYGDPRNAMGEAKWIMGGSFAGTLYRLHGTSGFGRSWREDVPAGCARLLNDGILWLSSRVQIGQTWVVFTN